MTTSGDERNSWSTVATILRRDIATGLVGRSAALDTEAELCRRFAVSRITVRRALQTLRDEGLVGSQRGSGWRVTDSPPVTSLQIGVGQRPPGAVAPTVTRDAHRWKAGRPSTTIAGAIRRHALAIPSAQPHGLQWTYRQRADGTLFDIAEVWFAPLVALMVDRLAHQTHALAKLVSESVNLGDTSQLMWADITTTSEQRSFGQSSPTAVLVLERVTRTIEGEVAFVSVHRHLGSFARIVVDLPLSHVADGRTFDVTANDRA